MRRAIVTPSVAAVFGSFSVRKTFAQAVVAAQLGHLALDPDVGSRPRCMPMPRLNAETVKTLRSP